MTPEQGFIAYILGVFQGFIVGVWLKWEIKSWIKFMRGGR